MRFLKQVAVLLSVIGLMTFTSCEKEGPTGPQGEQGEQGVAGPEARVHVFSLKFNAGETFETYDKITNFNKGDVVIVYILWDTYGGDDFYTQLPFMINSNSINVWPEFSESDGLLFINTTLADGTTGSPWSSSATLNFKAVVLKGSYKMEYPNVNFNDYEEVKTVLNLAR